MATKITAKEALRYILQDILELEDSDIRILSKKGITKFRNLKNLSIEKVNQFYDQEDINDGLATDLSLFIMYMTLEDPSVSDLMELDADTWNAMDFSTLRTKYFDIYGPKNTTKSFTLTNSTVTKQNVITSKQPPSLTTIYAKDVDVTNFLKYVYVKLQDRIGIMQFYRNLQSQGLRYNIYLRKDNEIDKDHGVIPDGLTHETEEIISTAIYSKCMQDKIIDESFTEAINLRATTRNGFQFLQLLLQLTHPKLTITSVATIDIPKFSDSNDLFVYAKEILDFVDKHNINSRTYTQREISEMYLSHLDDEKYEEAKSKCESTISTSTTVDALYCVPALAGTIEQLISTQHNKNKSIIRTTNINDMVCYPSPPLQEDNVFSTQKYPNNQKLRQRGPFINTNGYKGVCHACGGKNHHTANCYFLMKLKQCLAYLKDNPTAGETKRNIFQKKNLYNNRRDTIKTLQDANFIPFQNISTDVFLDTIDDNDPVYTPDNNCVDTSVQEE